MWCSNCGKEILEGQRFCIYNGAVTSQPLSVQQVQYASVKPHKSSEASNNKALISVVVLVIVLLSVIGLAYTQPWSRIIVNIENQSMQSIQVMVYIDGRLVTVTSIAPVFSNSFAEDYSVTPGNHRVTIAFAEESDFYQKTVHVGVFGIRVVRVIHGTLS